MPKFFRWSGGGKGCCVVLGEWNSSITQLDGGRLRQDQVIRAMIRHFEVSEESDMIRSHRSKY